MSKITNYSLTRSGTRCFCTHRRQRSHVLLFYIKF